MAGRLIVALDLPTTADAVHLARRLRHVVQTVKIGSALFTRSGPEAVRRLRALGFNVMLDLKFFDIPSTVEQSVRAATHHRVTMLTVHAEGGHAMLRAAVKAAHTEAARLRIRPPLVLGVTVLTSSGTGHPTRVATRVLRLAREAARAGCDGVVASAQEAALIRRRLGARLKIFCPAIRPAGVPRGDQARVASPREALVAGADGLIVGRPITAAADPVRAARRILTDMGASACP